MTAYILDCSHVDTCLPCFLTDAHTRDGELLLGVPVDGSTLHWQLRRDLEAEVYGDDNLPEEITDEQVKAAIADCFGDAKPLAEFDVSLELFSEDSDDYCYAWFLFTWRESE